MKSLSVWHSTAQQELGPALVADATADVAIVGGGITGVTLALLLAEEGRSVVLLEGAAIGAGSTGNSTGNLYETVSDGLHGLVERWGAETCKMVTRSRREAFDFIAHHATRLDANCRFERCSLYRYALEAKGQEAVEREHRAAVAAGLQARLTPGLPDELQSRLATGMADDRSTQPAPGAPEDRQARSNPDGRQGPAAPGRSKPPGPVLVIDDQAQFHPLVYVRALARRAALLGCRIFERSAALEIDHDRHLVRTAAATVRAQEIVLATHSPVGVHPVQVEMKPSQEFGLAFRGTAALAPGIFWGSGERPLSLRGLTTDEGDFVICVGGRHPTAQYDPLKALADLEAQAAEHLGMRDVAWRWSAQNFRAADGLPYIGRDSSGAFLATGFGTDGLVYGTLAATILADEILHRDNRWKKLYDASRFAPLKAAGGVVEETASVVKALVRDRVGPSGAVQLSGLTAGSGSLVEVDGETLAGYRDTAGTLYLLSPVCTHMKCRVRWNAFETSWDCPCHGSRYAPDGHVIEGPALQPLQRKPVDAD